MWHIKGLKPAIQVPDLIGRRSALSFSVTFTEDMIYEEPNNEGADFRKLTGLSLCRWNYHKDACLIGWRYWRGRFELVPYFHFAEPRDGFDNEVGAYRGYFNNKSIQGYSVGDTVEGTVLSTYGFWEVKIGDRIFVHSHDSFENRMYRVLTWFGGTLPPSKTFCIPLYIK